MDTLGDFAADRVRIAEGLSLSRLVYGMWRLGDDADTSPAHVQAKIESCLEQGITTMDQADIYGGYEAEEILGNAFRAAPHLKDKVEIVTKCNIVAPVGRHAAARVKYYDTGAAHITQSVEDSLRLMQIERIDMLLMHRQDPMMDHEETGAALAGAIMGFPLLVRPIRLSLEAIDTRVEAAAATLGASPVWVVLTVTVPLALPGVIAGMVLAFARALGEFGATITFASNIPGETRTLPIAIYTFIQVPGGENEALQLILISIAVSLSALIVSELIARRVKRLQAPL